MPRAADPAELAIFNALFASVAEEMGVTLGRTAHSPNIKERKDFSCAVFNPQGDLVAQAAHIPVHLGAMPTAIRMIRSLAPFRPGDVAILNDPYLGGTHLPDVTLASPVFAGRTLVGFVASRAHHADIGGMAPGSMPVARELWQEGVIIPPLRLVAAGRLNEELYALILRNVRSPEQSRGDFDAQLAANRTGERRLLELVERYGVAGLRRRMADLLDYAERMTRSALREVPAGSYSFEDALDDDGESPEPVPIRVTLTFADGAMHCDFSGTALARPASVNAVATVTRSAVYYCVRCLLDDAVPSNEGCFRPVRFTLPERSLVNANPPHAVSAGNVETSQRITDVVLGAMARALPDRIPAASSGTMNNLTIGGWDEQRATAFTYYETIAGGAGAGPLGDGLSGVHTHMTNTLNTPVEALELAYPFRVRAYTLRPGTGGAGRHRGGDGVRREYEFTGPATCTLMTDRRRTRPYGLRGGEPGAPGVNTLQAAATRRLPAKTTFQVTPGERLIVETPGGGGWGEAGRITNDGASSDAAGE
ncbi:MAG TPA: hydantoinase B/oxoprolinase family protein [Dehalococcoidia bacterium]|nr:hydantoinase B/oxoprolinase family protein [Dehalococcoidia bacterium]